jgi:hypothetical protein
MNPEQPMRALLELIEADRAGQCAQILGEETARASALVSQAHALARTRMRQAFTEQRLHLRESVAAAQARLATQRRLHAQQRTAAQLELAWQQLPGELLSRWREPVSRAAWVSQVLSTAQASMPAGEWTVVHATDWPAAEQQAAAGWLRASARSSVVFLPDTDIAAGLKVLAGGNAIDGTLAGLLADRPAIEAQLLRALERSP